VLTSKHAVKSKPPSSINVEALTAEEAKNLGGLVDGNKISGGNYKITVIGSSNQPEVYQVNNYDRQVFLDEKLDIAVITFESKKEYSIANLSSDISKESESYIYGFKYCSSSNSIEKMKEFNKGKIIELASSSDNEGYGVEYSNLSILGMSGSPVINDSGQVVAIHGKRKNNNQKKHDEGVNSVLRGCTAIPSDFHPNRGISMKDIKNSNLATKFAINFVK
jgi:hypothetical protein